MPSKGASPNDRADNTRQPASGASAEAFDINRTSVARALEPDRSADEEEQRHTDIDFGQLLDQFEEELATLEEGEVVRGTVVGLSERGVVIDFGYKSEGIVNPAEFIENGQLTVKAGDEVEVLVKSMETADGLPVLSRADAVRMKAWDDLEKAYREGSSVKGRVIDRIKGGLRVDIDGIAAFLPGSQVDVRSVRNLDSLRNQIIEAKVIKLNRKRSNVVLSRKAVIEQENTGRKDQTLQQIEEDIVVEGQIKNLTDYGAFVDLGGVDGLLHVTDMSWGRLLNPNELFRVGDNIQVKVLKFDRERERVSLGYKQLLPDPWSSVAERFPVGTRVTGKVASVADYGVFVEIETGIEGLVHVSEMSSSKRVKRPSEVVNPGDMIEVEVLSLDPRAHRISLGMKQVQDTDKQLLAGSEPAVEGQSSVRISNVIETAAKQPTGTKPIDDVAESGSIVSRPDVDLFTEGDLLVILIDLPGLRRDDLDLSLDGNLLTVSGERELSTRLQRNSYYLRERGQDRFMRRLPLPPNLDLEKIHAEYANGVLRVTIPKLGEIAEAYWEIKKERNRMDPNSEAYKRDKAQLESTLAGHIVAYAHGQRIAVGKNVQELTDNIPAEYRQTSLFIKDIPEGPPIRFRRPFFVRHKE